MCAPKESKFMGHACLKNFGFGSCKNAWGCVRKTLSILSKNI
jgi:hypothetical protein